MPWRYALLVIGAFATSMSVILIRLSHTQPVVLSALRLLVAAVLLAPVFWMEWRRHARAFTGRHWRRTLLPSLLLAAHFSSWAYGARLTAAAQASLIVNLVPVVMPFLLYWLARERINRIEVVGTFIAIGGVIALTAHDAFTGGGDLLGNLICFGSMCLVASYVALGRLNRDFPSLWLYVIPIYLQAGLFCLVFAIASLGKIEISSAREGWIILGLAVVPTILGHTLLNYAVRHLRGQIVGLIFASQFVFPTVFAYFIFHERPATMFYVSSVVVFAGIAIVILSAPIPPPTNAPE